MSCRWARASHASGASGVPAETDAAAVYRELARSRREEEFRWFARSQGVAQENVDRMWTAALAETCSGPDDDARFS